LDWNAFFETHRVWLLPVLILLARVVDVSLGTLRMVFIARGYHRWAPVAGFFEVLVWIIAIAQIMKNLDSPVTYLAYAAGYATGTFVGLRIEQRIALGHVVVRVIPQTDTSSLVAHLREERFGVTTVDAEGAHGPVKVVFTLIPRSAQDRVLRLIRTHNPRAFFTVEDVRSTSHGFFPSSLPRRGAPRPAA